MIYPAILTDSIDIAQQQLDLVVGKVKIVQIDYIDLAFADEATLTPSELVSLDFHSMQADIHIMTNDPFSELLEVNEVGKTVRAVIAQVERMPSQRAFIDEVKRAGWKVGLSLDLYTPVSAIEEDVWKDLDVVQIMTIHAGKQQQQFERLALDKVSQVREYLAAHKFHAEITVDGGINPETLAQCKAAGADSFAVGSYLWKSNDVAHALASLQSSA